MLTIWNEIQEVKNGEADKEDNVLINAPHPEYESSKRSVGTLLYA